MFPLLAMKYHVILPEASAPLLFPLRLAGRRCCSSVEIDGSFQVAIRYLS